MDTFDNYLDKFDTKLKHHIENDELLSTQISKLSHKLIVESHQRRKEQYQTEDETHECRQLSDQLAKKESELKIEFEKKIIEVNEEKHLNSIQWQRTVDQMSQLKHDMRSLQTKNWQLEQSNIHLETQIKRHSTFQSIISSDVTQMNKKISSIDTELKSSAKVQSQLKTMIESAKKFNAELRREVNDRNETNCSLKREMHCLKHLVSKLKLMCCHYKRLIVDKDSQHISLNNQIDLLKNENSELKRILSKTFDEHKALMKMVNRLNVNSGDSAKQTRLTYRETIPEKDLDVED